VVEENNFHCPRRQPELEGTPSFVLMLVRNVTALSFLQAFLILG